MQRRTVNLVNPPEFHLPKPPNRFIHPFRYFFFQLKTREGRKQLWKDTAGFVLWAGAALILIVVAVLAYFTQDLPSPDKLSQRHVAESTKILDRTGQVVLYEIHGEENRTAISFDQMPQAIKDATVSAEDANFYNHHGLDFKAIARASLADIMGQSREQGASTITQQLIKNSVLDTSKTFTRKIKEAILSLELEQKFNKNQILEMYLNEIPYGSNAYGIEAAAQTFFGKNAASLDLAECTFLAALPQAPTYYSPYGTHTDDLKNRQDWILDRMVQLGYTSQQEADAAKQEDVLQNVKPIKNNILAPHFVMYVKDWLVNKYGEDAVQQGGFKVITTLDYQKQQLAEQTITDQAPKNEKNFNSHNAALVSIDPKTGEILAMVGSRDYFDTANDGNVNVATSERQPGSSFKPFAYAVAFSKGYNPDTMLFDVKTNFKTSTQDYTPQNYNGQFNGPISMREALDNSLNIPAVETLYLAGVSDTVNFARSMGITTLKPEDNYGLALVLGGGGVTLLDETSAYGVFANDGVRMVPQAVLSIQDSSGKTIYQKDSNDHGQRVVSTDIARTINNVLSDNSARAKIFGTHSALYIDGYNVAAKSGTTQEFRDGWLLGYTPDIVTGVWTGNNDSSPTNQGEGVYTAGPIWNTYMKQVLPNLQKDDFPPMPDIKKPDKPMLNGKLGDQNQTEVKIDKKTGLLAEDNCPDKCTKKVTFTDAHCILYYVDRNDPLGPIPKNPEIDPQFKNWEDAVQGWYNKNGDNGKNKDNNDNYIGAPPTDTSCSCKDSGNNDNSRNSSKHHNSSSSSSTDNSNSSSSSSSSPSPSPPPTDTSGSSPAPSTDSSGSSSPPTTP